MLDDPFSNGRYAWRWPGSLAVLALPRWLTVLALGGLSLFIFWAGLLVPYNLFTLRLAPLVNTASLTSDKPLAQAGFVFTLAALSGVYYLAWRACRAGARASSGRQPRALWAALLTSVLAANLALLWLYPIDAADIFDIDRGRITARYGGNPFYETPRAHAQDPFFQFVAWPDYTSAYGPLWELMAAGAARLAGEDRLANVVAFKLLNLAFYFGCVGLIAAILLRHAPERALQGVCLFAWNPLVIYETAANGHNDIVMVFFILLGIWAVLRGRFTWAALALLAGALIKFIPLLLLPVAVAVSLRALPTGRARLRYAVFTSLAAGLTTAVLFVPFWRGGDMLAFQRRATLFTTSLPAVAQAGLQPALGVDASQKTVAAVATLLIGAAVLYHTWRAWRGIGWLAPVQASAHILLFYLLIACLWFQAWYALWPLALAALLPEGAVARTIVLLSYAAAWKTVVFSFFLYRGGPLPSRLWRESLLGPITLGLAWLYVAYRLVLSGRRRVRPRLAGANSR
jgi:hypothetical protein